MSSLQLSAPLVENEESFITLRPGLLRVSNKNYFSYFSSKTYVMGTQKNCLNEMVLLNIQNKC